MDVTYQIHHLYAMMDCNLIKMVVPPWIHAQNEERRYQSNLKQNFDKVQEIWQPTINEDGVPSINLSTSSLGNNATQADENIWGGAQ